MSFWRREVLQKGRGIEKHIIFLEDARIPTTTMKVIDNLDLPNLPTPDPPDAICGSSPPEWQLYMCRATEGIPN